MQALSDAASAYAQGVATLHEPHPDISNAREGLLMMEQDLAAATQLPEWIKTNPAYPVFGSTVKDKDNLFARCHGTVVGKAEWRATGLFVSDVRFVFPSNAHCQAYYQAAMVGHPELFFDADDGTMQPRMVEMQSPDKSFHVGDICRTFCGPTALAREKLMASVAAGKAMEELQLIAERAIKTVHLLYLFCVVITPRHIKILKFQNLTVLVPRQMSDGIVHSTGTRNGQAMRHNRQRVVPLGPRSSTGDQVQGPIGFLESNIRGCVCATQPAKLFCVSLCQVGSQVSPLLILSLLHSGRGSAPPCTYPARATCSTC
jgi:hypothetical protein